MRASLSSQQLMAAAHPSARAQGSDTSRSQTLTASEIRPADVLVGPYSSSFTSAISF